MDIGGLDGTIPNVVGWPPILCPGGGGVGVDENDVSLLEDDSNGLILGDESKSPINNFSDEPSNC